MSEEDKKPEKMVYKGMKPPEEEVKKPSGLSALLQKKPKDKTDKKRKEKTKAKSEKASEKKSHTQLKPKTEKAEKEKKKTPAKKRPKKTLKVSKSKFISIGAVVLLVGLIGYGIYRGNDSKIVAEDPGELLASQDTAQEITREADFSVLMAEDIPPENQQYDASIQVFFFQDELSGSKISVNQQRLPLDIAEKANGIKNLALSKKGVTEIFQLETLKGPVYLSTLENDRQVAIFKHQELLIFIESTSNIPVENWLDYINKLK